MSNDIGLYLHIPFCLHKCNYCAFVSYEEHEADIPAYLNVLKGELIQRSAGEHVCSIYFGGGTPSLLTAAQIEDVLYAIDLLFTKDGDAEITIEANPGTVNKQYLADIRAAGVNRLSIGVQSLSDDELTMLGRIHNAAEAREAVHFAREAGFDNLNIDLIYGLPGQTIEDWKNTLNEVVDMDLEHLSLYSLTVEDNTEIWRAIENKDLLCTDPDLAADQYELAEDLLAMHGYKHYEISNWAKPGRECKHNLIYWQNRPYLGVGVAAHSHLNGYRTANTPVIEKYMAAQSDIMMSVVELNERINPEMQLAEMFFLGLRMCEGIYLDDIQNRLDVDPLERYGWRIEELVSDGLLEYNYPNIRLSRRGRLLSNEVLWRFLPD